MSIGREGAPDVHEDPGDFTPGVLTSYLQSTFDRAFKIDRMSDESDHEGFNGTFTHQEVVVRGDGLLQDAWRVDMRPPVGGARRKGYKAQVYIILDPSIDVMGGELFEASGPLLVREYKKGKWESLMLIDEQGATNVETVDVIDVDGLIATAKEADPIKRAGEIFERLSSCNIVASTS